MGTISSYCYCCDLPMQGFGVSKETICIECGMPANVNFVYQAAFMYNPIHRQRLRGERFVLTELQKFEKMVFPSSDDIILKEISHSFY